MPTNITTPETVRRCIPFLLRVMVFSPESGYKFTIEVQKACTAENEEVWKLLFDLYKKKTLESDFDQIVSVEFVAGDPNDIDKVAAITDEGMKRAQVRAFRDNVYPLVKPFGEDGQVPTEADQAAIDAAMKKAINA